MYSEISSLSEIVKRHCPSSSVKSSFPTVLHLHGAYAQLCDRKQPDNESTSIDSMPSDKQKATKNSELT